MKQNIKSEKNILKKKPWQPQKCDGCGKVRYVYKVRIDKGVTEHWCQECIDDEEQFSRN